MAELDFTYMSTNTRLLNFLLSPEAGWFDFCSELVSTALLMNNRSANFRTIKESFFLVL